MPPKAYRIAFDIETQPNKHRLHLMPEPEVALGNLKDPIKIAEKIAASKQAQKDRAALDANFARVVCISVAFYDNMEAIASNTVLRSPLRANGDEEAVDLAEKELLRWFWDYARSYTRFVTFNGSTFDVPFLLRRSLLLGVRPIKIDCHPYRVIDGNGEHLDLCKLLHDSETAGTAAYKRNLHFYAGLILNEHPPYGADLDKASIGEMYDRGEFETIKQVCKWDAEATLHLAEAVTRVYC